MNLTTWSFIAPVIAMAVLSLGLSSWLFGRVTSWKRRLAALGGFALTLTLVAASIGLVANRNMMWVSSVNDLFSALSQPAGEGNVTVKEVPGDDPSDDPSSDLSAATTHQSDDKPARDRAAKEAVKGEVPAASQVTAADRSQQNAFTYDSATKLWHATFHGTASGLTRSVTMWLPDGVTPNNPGEGGAHDPGTADTAGEKLNVILFNHGYPGTDEGVVNALAIDKILGNAVKTGELPATAFVVPDIGVSGQPDCVDIAGRPPVETFFTQDVPRILIGQLANVSHQLSDWTLAGISSGAYCAPVLQIRHTGSFFSALSLGGYNRPLLGSLSRADKQSQAAFTISTMVAQHAPQGNESAAHDSPVDAGSTQTGDREGERIRLFIAGATSDKDSRDLVAQLAGLQPSNVDLGFDLDPKGGHSWSTWKRQLPKALTWLAQERSAYLQARGDVSDAGSGTGSVSAVGNGSDSDTATTPGANEPSSATGRSDGYGTAEAAGNSTETSNLEEIQRATLPADADPPFFELRGTGTLVVLALLSVLATVLLISFGPRIGVARKVPAPKVRAPKHALDAAPKRGARRQRRAAAVFAVRAFLILFVALLVFFALFAIDNRFEVYFATWEDLTAHWIDLFLS